MDSWTDLFLSPDIHKMEPKWDITFGTGIVQVKCKQRLLVGFQATEEKPRWLQGETFELVRGDYKSQLKEFRKTGVMEQKKATT